MQTLYGESFEVDLANPDYVAYARSFGVNARSVAVRRSLPRHRAAARSPKAVRVLIHVPVNPQRPLDMA